MYTVYSIRQILQTYQSGESVGYTVKSMEQDFAISSYPLEQTEFLYDSKQGIVDWIFVSHHSHKFLLQDFSHKVSNFLKSTNKHGISSKMKGTKILIIPCSIIGRFRSPTCKRFVILNEDIESLKSKQKRG